MKVDITPAMGARSTTEQIAYQVPQEQKMAALCTLLQSTEGETSLIFGRTKFGVEKLGKQLSKLGFTNAPSNNAPFLKGNSIKVKLKNNVVWLYKPVLFSSPLRNIALDGQVTFCYNHQVIFLHVFT